MTDRKTLSNVDRRTGITTKIKWHQDWQVVAEYYRSDGSFIKSEVLGYATAEEGFMRLADGCILG